MTLKNLLGISLDAIQPHAASVGKGAAPDQPRRRPMKAVA
jgi:hypothetical protein